MTIVICFFVSFIGAIIAFFMERYYEMGVCLFIVFSTVMAFIVNAVNGTLVF